MLEAIFGGMALYTVFVVLMIRRKQKRFAAFPAVPQSSGTRNDYDTGFGSGWYGGSVIGGGDYGGGGVGGFSGCGSDGGGAGGSCS